MMSRVMISLAFMVLLLVKVLLSTISFAKSATRQL